MSIHPNHRGPSKRSLKSLCAALALAVAGSSGCVSTPHAHGADGASSELTALAPPSPPRFLVDLDPRALGPLQAASEERLELVSHDCSSPAPLMRSASSRAAASRST